MAPFLSSAAECTTLVQRVALGDEVAFTELYDRTSSHVLLAATRTLRSPEHAAEVVQEVFLHVWQRADSFDQTRGTVHGWLGMLAHRRAVDRVRQVTRSVERDHRAAYEPDVLVDDVAQTGLRSMEAGELRAAVAVLPVRQRDAVVLTYFDGCTHEQAARILRVPIGTLKSRVHAATASLRRHYAALELEPAVA